MSAPSPDTPQRILDAAKRVFVRKGMDGVVMQDIAREARISRTALHYYFRSKDRLFDAVLDDRFTEFLPHVEAILCQDIPLRRKVTGFVDQYLDLLKANPYLPHFIMTELNRNPERILHRMREKGLFSQRIRQLIQAALHPVAPDADPAQFIMNLMSLCLFPFIAKPLVWAFFTDGARDAFDRFIEGRKKVIVDALMGAVTEED